MLMGIATSLLFCKSSGKWGGTLAAPAAAASARSPIMQLNWPQFVPDLIVAAGSAAVAARWRDLSGVIVRNGTGIGTADRLYYLDRMRERALAVVACPHSVSAFSAGVDRRALGASLGAASHAPTYLTKRPAGGTLRRSN
jgi:hypothetical protein